MLKKQVIFVLCGLVILASLYLLGKTVMPKANTGQPMPPSAPAFIITDFISSAKKEIRPNQAMAVANLENIVTRGDVVTQQVAAYNQLASYWKDSIGVLEPYFFYLGEAAKLEKSEKNLTFAAQLILDNLRGESNEGKLNWKADLSLSLFQQALELNPESVDAKVGVGSCYIFGKGRFGGPQETMKGITQLLEVVRKDSNNLNAQFALGVGGYVSGQYDKAIPRLLKVVTAQPSNMEAVAFLADTYAAKGEKAEAIKWYQVSKRLANNPAYSKEADERIRSLQ